MSTLEANLELVSTIPEEHQKENVGSSSENQSKPRRMGSLKGQRLISEGYDIDESNDEIAKMFGVEG